MAQCTRPDIALPVGALAAQSSRRARFEPFVQMDPLEVAWGSIKAMHIDDTICCKNQLHLHVFSAVSIPKSSGISICQYMLCVHAWS
jgi:hypothetical protein